MTQTLARAAAKKTAKAFSFDLDTWMSGRVDVGDAGRQLLSAYLAIEAEQKQREKASRIAAETKAAETAAVSSDSATDGGATTPLDVNLTSSDEASPSELIGKSPEIGPRSGGAVPINRIAELTEIEVEQIPGLHGRLIAAGFLTPELLGRYDGLAYRITSEGRRHCEEPAAASGDSSDEETGDEDE